VVGGDNVRTGVLVQRKKTVDITATKSGSENPGDHNVIHGIMDVMGGRGIMEDINDLGKSPVGGLTPNKGNILSSEQREK
jgi:hypothetical protein